LGARRAWRRLVRGCALGDPRAQDAVRAVAGELPEADVLDLLAVAPGEPAERAAYLALIGQDGQRLALDPEGALLALAYRAAGPEVRERLRGVLAAGGDTEVIRVVVAGERRDRVTELSRGELDYLGRHLAEGGRWDELRRLATDLPLAEAAAAARLLPEAERTGAVAALAARDPRPAVERLPRTRQLVGPSRHCLGVALSPDASEAVFLSDTRSQDGFESWLADMRLGDGHISYRAQLSPLNREGRPSLLHLGDRILVRTVHDKRRRATVWCLWGERVTVPGHQLSDLRRSSAGAVMLDPGGLLLVDAGADRPRRVPIPALGGAPLGGVPLGGAEPGAAEPGRGIVGPEGLFALATLPAERLVAFFDRDHLYVVDEDGELLHDAPTPGPPPGPWGSAALTFLSPRSLALHRLRPPGGGDDGPEREQYTEVWDLPPGGDRARRAEALPGPIAARWPSETWAGLPLDPAFAGRIHSPDGLRTDTAPPWVAAAEPERRLVAIDPWGDILVTVVAGVLEVHSSHLPAARALLERPMLHFAPGDLARVDEVRTRVGAPDVREALDLLSECLDERFGGDIALGTAGGPVPAAGPHDIGLSVEREDA
ncbi:hypothetical protein, partial [Streptomyces sp. SBT349]|uniref:hypothetical protein n=1 Tax=Streptomyces sp. SBT349 TaxID=1580539 RepID=UPI00066B6B36